jgi:hypothetical protein
MNSKILNKRKSWLDETAKKSLDSWTKSADSLKGFADTMKYFGIKQKEDKYENDALIINPCFRQSLDLFKIVLKKQIAKENIGLPSLDKPPCYDALITILGFSPEPLMHTILSLGPKKVYPIATEESAKDYYKVELNAITGKPDGELKYFVAIIDRYKESSQTIRVEPIERNVSSIGSLDTFKRVREIIKKERIDNPEAKIALDITGGKKSTDASAFLTVSIENDIDIFYVDFEDYKDSKACCGTEFLNKLENPYDIYNIREEALVEYLWQRQDFDAVNVITTKTINKLTLEKSIEYGLLKERNRLLQIQSASRCYSEWSRFNYSKALENARIKDNVNFDFYINSHKDILSKITNCKQIRNNAFGAILLACDRLMRGIDAFVLDEIDKSALFYTQAIEVLCEFRLYDIMQKGLVVPYYDISQVHINISSLIKFLWECSKKKYNLVELEINQYIKIKWVNESRFEKASSPSAGKIIEKLCIRNNLAHFNCFDVEKNKENKEKVSEFKETVINLIELFIKAYKEEPELSKITINDLCVMLEYANINNFEKEIICKK